MTLIMFCSDNLRIPEKITVNDNCTFIGDQILNLTKSANPHCVAIFDNRIQTQFSALLNIVKTIFILLVLLYASCAFTIDTNEIVVYPIQNMTKIRYFKNIFKVSPLCIFFYFI